MDYNPIYGTMTQDITKPQTIDPDMRFPYPNPYPIQKDFMKHLYETLDKENGPRFSIMQSPTGTGKTLSVICGALHWLRKAKIQKEKDNDSDEPSWVLDHYSKKRNLEGEDSNASKKRRRIENISSILGVDGMDANILSPSNRSKHISQGNDEDLLLDEVANVTNLIKELYHDEIEDSSEANTTFQTPKIIFCTRTHSQITQFVKEFQKTEYKNDISLISLGSRSNLCINKKVRNLSSTQMQTDRCQSLRQQKKCEYYDASGISLFTETTLNRPTDIEDLVRIGKRVIACPYYGSRRTMLAADLILMPYSSLVNERIRKSLGIQTLKDCVIIFDEGHNLEDALESSHSSPLSTKQLNATLQQLNRYMEKYKHRLKRATLNRVQQLVKIVQNCYQFMLKSPTSSVIGINEFLCETKIEDINLWDIQEFIDKSKLAQKLNGFIDRFRDESVSNGDELMQNCIHPTLSFLLTLTNVGSDGRLIVEKNEKGNHVLRFLLLNPSVYFEPICKEAHAVILAGGTMEPINRVTQQLFPALYRDSVTVFECGHVIPDNHLLPICLSEAKGQKFNFTLSKRYDIAMVNRLGEAVLSFCTKTPGGVICFFPSYAYEEFIIQTWMKQGHIREIQKVKQFFREPKQSNEVENTLERYKSSIDNHNSDQTGGFLSCVIGGKMSEGINFADNFGRLVCVVGLPYPNQNDPSLQEKIKFLDSTFGRNSGSRYYRDLCMNAVNQSIGRSIRHSKDYASIILIDERYCDISIQKELPKWIQDKKIRNCNTQDQVNQLLDNFFKSKASHP